MSSLAQTAKSVLDVLKKTAGAFKGLRLAARLNDPAVFNDASGVVRVFIPDLHLLSKEESHEKSEKRRYRFSFDHYEGTKIPRAEALTALVDNLVALVSGDGGVAPAPLEIHQLGDYADLWRSTANDLDALLAIIRRRDYGFLKPLSEHASFVAGNHDAIMAAAPKYDVAKSRLLGADAAGAPNILVTHGDAFDPLEDMGGLNEVVVRLLAAGHNPNVYDLRVESARLYKPAPNTEATNVAHVAWSRAYRGAVLNDIRPELRTSLAFRREAAELTNTHELLPLFLDAYFRWEDAAGDRWIDVPTEMKRRLMRLGLGAPPAGSLPRLCVVGHSHHARIVVARDADDPSDRCVLMDCGAWIEDCKFPDATGTPTVRSSCQIGVQAGSNLSVYQLDVDG